MLVSCYLHFCIAIQVLCERPWKHILTQDISNYKLYPTQEYSDGKQFVFKVISELHNDVSELYFISKISERRISLCSHWSGHFSLTIRRFFLKELSLYVSSVITHSWFEIKIRLMLRRMLMVNILIRGMVLVVAAERPLSILLMKTLDLVPTVKCSKGN